jgi:hypothetical protein
LKYRFASFAVLKAGRVPRPARCFTWGNPKTTGRGTRPVALFAWYESDPERRVFIAQSNGRSRVVYTRRKAPKIIRVTSSAGKVYDRRINAISETFEEAEARVVRATDERAAAARAQLKGFVNRNQPTLAPAAVTNPSNGFRRFPPTKGRGGLGMAIGAISLAGTGMYILNKNNKKK